MSKSSETLRIPERVNDLLLTGLGLLMMPVAAVIAPRYVAESFREANRIRLSDPAYRDRIDVVTVEETPSMAQRSEIHRRFRGLIGAGDWSTIAADMATWDRTSANAPDGTRLVFHGLDAIADAFASGFVAAGDCMPETLPILPESALARLEAAVQDHPKDATLAAITAHFWVLEAWRCRGRGYEHEIPKADWKAALAAIERSRAVIAPFADTEGSTLLAWIRMSWMPFLCESQGELRAAFEAMVDADPKGQIAACWWGYLMLPRWFGEPEEYDARMREAAFRARGAAGLSFYASAYLYAAERDLMVVHAINTEMFREALQDLIHLRGRDPAAVARVVQIIWKMSIARRPAWLDRDERAVWDAKQADLRAIAQDLTRCHLTAFCPAAWRSERAALDLISEAMAAELETGARLTMGRRGIRAEVDSAAA